jgi:hypothetical protein
MEWRWSGVGGMNDLIIELEWRRIIETCIF